MYTAQGLNLTLWHPLVNISSLQNPILKCLSGESFSLIWLSASFTVTLTACLASCSRCVFTSLTVLLSHWFHALMQSTSTRWVLPKIGDTTAERQNAYNWLAERNMKQSPKYVITECEIPWSKRIHDYRAFPQAYNLSWRPWLKLELSCFNNWIVASSDSHFLNPWKTGWLYLKPCAALIIPMHFWTILFYLILVSYVFPLTLRFREFVWQ